MKLDVQCGSDEPRLRDLLESPVASLVLGAHRGGARGRRILVYNVGIVEHETAEHQDETYRHAADPRRRTRETPTRGLKPYTKPALPAAHPEHTRDDGEQQRP